MFRRFVIAALGAILLALSAASQAQSSTQNGITESENPINDQGSSYHYRSIITSCRTECARRKPAGTRVRRPPAPDQPHRPDRDGLRLPGRTLRAGARERHGPDQHPLARLLPEPELLRRGQRTCLGLADRHSALDRPGPHGPARMARPSHPLDVAGGASAGQGQGKRTKIFDWQVPTPGRLAKGSRQRRTLLDSREQLQGARGARSSRWWRSSCSASCSCCSSAGGAPANRRPRAPATASPGNDLVARPQRLGERRSVATTTRPRHAQTLGVCPRSC